MARKTTRVTEAALHKRIECTDAELRDLIRLAYDRCHIAIARSTQLCESTADQHAVVLHVIASLIHQAASCIKDGNGALARDSVSFTMDNLAMLLKGYKDAASGD